MAIEVVRFSACRTAVLAVVAALPASVLAAPALAQGANDCASAQRVKGYGTFAFDTNGATTDGSADALCNFFSVSQIYNDVWFSFTAPETFVVEVALCGGTSLDSKLAVYEGSTCSAPVIACNDDSCSLQSKVSFGAQAGQTYLVRIGAYSAADFGSGSFTVSPLLPLADATDPATGIRYIAVNATTWNASEALAQSLGGHLVSIGSQAEQDFVHANFGNVAGADRRVWIGFSDAASEGSFVWSDGTPTKYTNWNPGEPNNSGGVEHYAEMLGSNGKWNDLNDAGAGYAHIAVIEFPRSAPPCPADLNHSGAVDAQDIAAMLSAWGGAGGDITGDGTTNAQDIAALLSAWGPCQ